MDALFQTAPGHGAHGGGIFLLRTKPQRVIRLRHFTVKVQKRYRFPAWTVIGVGVLLLCEAFLSSELTPYSGDLGIVPHQRVIDAVEAQGGMALWSFPEARDFNRFGIGPFGELVVRTEPYPEALLQSQGYTGFGAVYPDHITVTEPGREWDRLLLEYAEGHRARPAWGLGELGYHGPPKRLNDLLTMFLVRERSRASILDALKGGRLYAVRPPPDYHLILEDFSLSWQGSAEWVPMGGELEVDGQAPLRIKLKISTSDGRHVPFTLRLIRSGTVLEVMQRRTPFEEILTANPPAAQRREFLRIEVTKPHQLLSNPIFVRRQR